MTREHSTVDMTELGDAPNRYGPSSARPAGGGDRAKVPRTVDAHSHILIRDAAEYAAPHVDPSRIPLLKFSNAATREINAVQDADRRETMVSQSDRIAVLDAMGIDLQIVAPLPPQCYYDIPLDHAVRASRMVNDGVAAWVEAAPERFAGLGTVPLQDGEEAARELHRAMKDLRLAGVQILTNVAGAELSDERFAPFWRAAEETGALVMIHPNGFTHGERMSDHYLSNVLGNPLETALALHHIIYSGLLERLPGLRILAAHGGGLLPSYAGRIDHAWGARRDAGTVLKEAPSRSLARVHFDSVVFTTHQLEYLVRLYGPERIVMGTDYPYDMAEYDPVQLVTTAELSDEAMALVGGGNALRLLDSA